MSKRKRFVITSILLSLGFIGIQFLDENYRYLSIGLLSLLTLILFYWSLREGIRLNLTISTFILPVFFTLGVGLFWFLLPSNIYTRIPVILFYAAGIYSLCLTSNIYTVSAIRTIALIRAAHGVGFVLTLITSFLIFDTILSLHAALYANTILVFITSFFLFFHGIWSTTLEEKPDINLFLSTLVPSILVSEVAMSLYFWPVTVVVGSLFLIVAMYVLLGLIQAKSEGRLFKQTIREYLTVGILVFLGMLFATHWGY